MNPNLHTGLSSKQTVMLAMLGALVSISACYIVTATDFGHLWLGVLVGGVIGLFLVEYSARQNPRFASKSILRYKTRRAKALYFIGLTLWTIVYGGLCEAGFPELANGFVFISLAVIAILYRIKDRKAGNVPANNE